MNTYIALLRAINVGGHRKIKMDDLRSMFSTLGIKNTKTYIQTGNVIFSSNENDKETLAQSIEHKIKEVFGHDVAVMIRTLDQFENLVSNNPYDGKDEGPYMLYITFFREKPGSGKQDLMIRESSSIERYSFVNGELFSLINKKAGQKENFSNNFVEKVTGIPGTTRNWNSVLKITNLAKDT